MMLSFCTPKSNSRRKTLGPSEINLSANRPTTRRSVLLSTSKLVQETPKTPLVLLREDAEPKTPENPKLPNALDPVMEKIRRDLNSPSAAARLRGQRALKSPNFRKANYEVFDVAREEQDLITEEERKPYKPKSIREVFENCRIYVEVRTGDDNRSAGIKSRLLADGIKVNEKLYKDTTHVIFKDGLLSTYKQAKKLNIPITTILWIETCKIQRRLVDVTKFQISNLERYENPELFPRMRRQKSMQPEISKQIVLKPKAATQNPKPTTIEETSFMSNYNETIEEIDERTMRECTGMEITLKDTGDMQTTTQISIELLSEERFRKDHRRLTTFTPRPMEQTKCGNLPWKAISSVDRRRTVFEVSHESSSTPTNAGGKKIIFNSANRIASNTRRSIFDISMNMFEMNCKALEGGKNEIENDNTFISSVPSSSSTDSINNKILQTQVPVPAVIRKRKLFSAVDTLDDTLTECKENLESTIKPESKRAKLNISTKITKKVEKVKDDRRKTISYFKTDKPMSAVKKSKTSTPKYVVCTNMSSADKQAMSAAIIKLGGHVESEVTEKTTHVVTPTAERTMNLLRGIIRACYIVNVNWINDSTKEGKFLDTTTYQHSVCNTQKIYERSVLGKRFKNHTFTLYGPFYIQKETIDNEKKVSYLKEIIEQCGGQLTKNRADAKIIVSDHPILITLVKQPTIVISTYIFDAAMQGRMISFTKYIPKKNI